MPANFNSQEEVVLGEKFTTEVEYLGRSTAELHCINHPDVTEIPTFKVDGDTNWCIFCASGFKALHKLVAIVDKAENND